MVLSAPCDILEGARVSLPNQGFDRIGVETGYRLGSPPLLDSPQAAESNLLVGQLVPMNMTRDCECARRG